MSHKPHFPIFTHQPELVYLDAAATSLKPQVVIDAERDYYSDYSANIHRGLYQIAERASLQYESARDTVAQFLHTSRREEVIFTKGATEGINLVASSMTDHINKLVQSGKKVLICVTILDHHANFVPWQQLALRTHAVFKVIKDEKKLAHLSTHINEYDEIVCAFPLVSNVTGEKLEAKKLIAPLRKTKPNAIVLVDASQAVTSTPINVQDLDCDFLVFSGHKLYGPTGIGVLYGKYDRLTPLPPYQYGGDMITSVSIEKSEFQLPPGRFEAGTPPIAQAIALAEAIRFQQSIGLEKIAGHKRELMRYLLSALGDRYNNVTEVISPQLSSTSYPESGIVSFTVKGIHAHDVAQILGDRNVCIRAGHHCAMPLHTHLGIVPSCRVSVDIWNTRKDIDTLLDELGHVIEIFHV